VPSPRLDAEILLEHTLKTPRVQLLIDPERILSYKEAQLYRELVEKRAERIPLQYIMGEAAFRYLVLKVTPDVLIPRAETELVAGEVIKIVRKLKEPRILDIGTGSGAIALSVAYEVENASVVATDVSEKALDVARENVRKYNLEDRVTFILSDLFKNLPILLKGHFDVIVSNPPYVSRGDLAQLAPEVGQHEPRVALTGDLNEDPLYYHRIIAREALEFLKAGGYLVLEIGAEQGREMTEILRQTGYGEVEIVKDLQGCDRIAKGKRI
jgi:release factor glutamine methyltransferase